MLGQCISAVIIQYEFAIRLCPESFSVCLGSSTCARVLGRIFFGFLGSCALAWAVKEVPDSEAGPPAAELPRHTDIDPLPKVKRERPVRRVSGASVASVESDCISIHWQSVESGRWSTDQTQGVRRRGSHVGS